MNAQRRAYLQWWLMISVVVLFAVVFAAMGILLGFAATQDIKPEHEPPIRTGDSLNSTSIMIEDSVQARVNRSSG